jgi:hypothetical protein
MALGIQKNADKHSSLFCSIVSDEGKKFLSPGVNVIKLFFLWPSKAEHLSLETLSSQVLEFEGKARANPIGAPFRCFLLGQTSGVTSKC